MGFWNWLKGVGRTLASAVVSFVKSDAARAILASAEGAIVNKIVVELSGMSYATLSNADKRNRAFAEAKQEIVSQGLEVRDHMIDLAISTAVAALKNLGPK